MPRTPRITVEHGPRGGYVVMVGRVRARKWRESSRTVYRASGIVVKVGGDEQCRSEIQNWKRFTREQRRHVAPLVAHGKVQGARVERGHDVLWVAQRLVVGPHPRGDAWFHATAPLFESLGVHDVHEHNVRMTKRGPIIVDYASNTGLGDEELS